MPRVSPVLRKCRKALQDSDVLKVLQSEITHELSSNRFQVLSLPSMPFLFLFCFNWNVIELSDSRYRLPNHHLPFTQIRWRQHMGKESNENLTHFFEHFYQKMNLNWAFVLPIACI
jgi:hypothetical protein